MARGKRKEQTCREGKCSRSQGKLNPCPICLEDPGDAWALVKGCCEAIFCGGCLFAWFERETTCPSCRAEAEKVAQGPQNSEVAIKQRKKQRVPEWCEEEVLPGMGEEGDEEGGEGGAPVTPMQCEQCGGLCEGRSSRATVVCATCNERGVHWECSPAASSAGIGLFVCSLCRGRGGVTFRWSEGDSSRRGRGGAGGRRQAGRARDGSDDWECDDWELWRMAERRSSR